MKAYPLVLALGLTLAIALPLMPATAAAAGPSVSITGVGAPPVTIAANLRPHAAATNKPVTITLR